MAKAAEEEGKATSIMTRKMRLIKVKRHPRGLKARIKRLFVDDLTAFPDRRYKTGVRLERDVEFVEPLRHFPRRKRVKPEEPGKPKDYSVNTKEGRHNLRVKWLMENKSMSEEEAEAYIKINRY